LSLGKSNILIFNIILFRYNQKAYKVERIDFTLTPETTFDKQGT